MRISHLLVSIMRKHDDQVKSIPTIHKPEMIHYILNSNRSVLTKDT